MHTHHYTTTPACTYQSAQGKLKGTTHSSPCIPQLPAWQALQPKDTLPDMLPNTRWAKHPGILGTPSQPPRPRCICLVSRRAGR